jgi:hypothetical protein
MSVLPAEIHNELAQLLDALQSSDNSVRSQAEEHLATNWTATKPEMLLMGLVEQIQGSNDPTVSGRSVQSSNLYTNVFCLLDSFLRSSHFPTNSLKVQEAAK